MMIYLGVLNKRETNKERIRKTSAQVCPGVVFFCHHRCSRVPRGCPSVPETNRSAGRSLAVTSVTGRALGQQVCTVSGSPACPHSDKLRAFTDFPRSSLRRGVGDRGTRYVPRSSLERCTCAVCTSLEIPVCLEEVVELRALERKQLIATYV